MRAPRQIALLVDWDAMALEYVESAAWVRRALETARRYRQPRIFDAIYLACAEDLDAELWTCQQPLRSVLRRCVSGGPQARPG